MVGDRATTLKTTFQVCNIGALTGPDINRYYVDLSSVRSQEAIAALAMPLGYS